jgi:hypothetical protein
VPGRRAPKAKLRRLGPLLIGRRRDRTATGHDTGLKQRKAIAPLSQHDRTKAKKKMQER